MLFCLTDSELLAAIQAAERQPDGTLALNLPASKLVENAATSTPVLTFCEATHTVMCDGCKSRLSPTQFRLARYVARHGRTSFETLQDTVWGKTTSDSCVRTACAKVNNRLLGDGFPVELVSNRGYISVESVG